MDITELNIIIKLKILIKGFKLIAIIDPWNRTETPDINPHVISTPVASTKIEKRQSLQVIVLGKLTATCKRIKTDPYLIPYTKNQLKMDQRLEHKKI